MSIWWRHQMETFFVLVALCAGNSRVTGEFPSQRPVMRSFEVFFDLCLNKRLSKQSWCWWYEPPPHWLWRHCNEGSRTALQYHVAWLVYGLMLFRGSYLFKTLSLYLKGCWFAINSLRPRQNGCLFADDIFKCIFLNENILIAINISLSFVPKGPIDNIPA